MYVSVSRKGDELIEHLRIARYAIAIIVYMLRFCLNVVNSLHCFIYQMEDIIAFLCALTYFRDFERYSNAQNYITSL